MELPSKQWHEDKMMPLHLVHPYTGGPNPLIHAYAVRVGSNHERSIALWKEVNAQPSKLDLYA